MCNWGGGLGSFGVGETKGWFEVRVMIWWEDYRGHVMSDGWVGIYGEWACGFFRCGEPEGFQREHIIEVRLTEWDTFSRGLRDVMLASKRDLFVEGFYMTS